MSSILNKENCTNCVARQHGCFGYRERRIQIGVDDSILYNPSHSVCPICIYGVYTNEIIRLRVVAVLLIVKRVRDYSQGVYIYIHTYIWLNTKYANKFSIYVHICKTIRIR